MLIWFIWIRNIKSKLLENRFVSSQASFYWVTLVGKRTRWGRRGHPPCCKLKEVADSSPSRTLLFPWTSEWTMRRDKAGFPFFKNSLKIVTKEQALFGLISFNRFIFRQKCGGDEKSSQLLLSRANERKKVTPPKRLKMYSTIIRWKTLWTETTGFCPNFAMNIFLPILLTNNW